MVISTAASASGEARVSKNATLGRRSTSGWNQPLVNQEPGDDFSDGTVAGWGGVGLVLTVVVERRRVPGDVAQGTGEFNEGHALVRAHIAQGPHHERIFAASLVDPFGWSIVVDVLAAGQDRNRHTRAGLFDLFTEPQDFSRLTLQLIKLKLLRRVGKIGKAIAGKSNITAVADNASFRDAQQIEELRMFGEKAEARQAAGERAHGIRLSRSRPDLSGGKGSHVSVYVGNEQAGEMIHRAADIQDDELGAKAADPVLVPKGLFRDRASRDAGVDDLDGVIRAALFCVLLKDDLQLKRIGIDVIGSAAEGKTGAQSSDSQDIGAGLRSVDLLPAEALRAEGEGRVIQAGDEVAAMDIGQGSDDPVDLPHPGIGHGIGGHDAGDGFGNEQADHGGSQKHEPTRKPGGWRRTTLIHIHAVKFRLGSTAAPIL